MAPLERHSAPSALAGGGRAAAGSIHGSTGTSAPPMRCRVAPRGDRRTADVTVRPRRPPDMRQDHLVRRLDVA